jgi:hypothetical protein
MRQPELRQPVAPRPASRQPAAPVEAKSVQVGNAGQPDDLDSLAREFSEPAAEPERAASAAVIAPDRRHATAAPEARPEIKPEAKHVFSEIDLDLGAAFKTAFDKLNTDRVERQMREATRLTPVERAERNAAAHARDLEAQFASAFEEELAVSVKAIQGARQARGEAAGEPVAAAPAQRQAEPQPARRAEARQVAKMPAKIQRGPDPFAALLDRELRAADLQAQVESEEAGEPHYAPPPRRSMALRMSGYGLAALLVAGLGAASYAYLGKGSQSSEPVVVKADSDPFKVRPDNRGGTQVANQDKAAYERLSGKFSNEAKQEKLIESAEEPVKISTAVQGDAVVAADPGAAAQAVSAGDQAGEKADERLVPGSAEKSRSLGAIQPRRVKTLAIRADGSVVPDQSAGAAEAAARIAAGGKDAVKAGTDPVKVDTVKLDRSAAASESAGKDTELKVASIAAGTQAAGAWAIQVSSQKTSADAESAYRNLQRKFPQLLEGRQMEIQKAEVADKGTFFRVRVLAPSKEEAGAFCDKLKGAGGSCFVTR